MLRRRLTTSMAIGLLSMNATAVEYSCDAIRKFDSGREYTPEQISRFQYSNRVEETKEGAFVSRCSLAPSEGRVTCDKYKMDRVELDENAKIKKYYLFKSQFDFQMFSNLYFVENNGRGGISFGKCVLVSP